MRLFKVLGMPVGIVTFFVMLAIGALFIHKQTRETFSVEFKEDLENYVKSAHDLDIKYIQKITPEDVKVLPIRPNSPSLNVPVLMYHHVGILPEKSDAIRRDLTVSVDDFKKQVEWLKSAGYSSISLQQVYEATFGKFILPQKPIVFSFDDGYADVFENAVPILVKNGFMGSFGIITQYPGHPDYATWEQILFAHNLGMEIVSHTQNHFDGTNINKYKDEYVYKNLAGARKDLADHGIDTKIIIYPYGHYTESYLTLAKRAGYVMGFTVHFGKKIYTQELMTEPRVRVHGQESLEKFKEILQR